MFFTQSNLGFSELGELGATKTAKKSAKSKKPKTVTKVKTVSLNAGLSANLNEKDFIYQATADFTGYFGAQTELERVITGAQGWTDYFSEVKGTSQMNGNRGTLQIVGKAIASEDESDIKIRIDKMLSNYFNNIQSSVTFSNRSQLNAALNSFSTKTKKNQPDASMNLELPNLSNSIDFLGGLGQGLGFGTPVVLLAGGLILLVLLKK